jgi:hypothetical protein
MKKIEAINYIISKKGYITFSDIFNLFENHEIVPHYLIDAELNEQREIKEIDLFKILMELA